MSISSEDGVDRDSSEYLRGYTEALDAAVQRLNNLMMQGTFPHPLKQEGIVKARNLVFELLKAAKGKLAGLATKAEPTPTLNPDQPKATTPTVEGTKVPTT